MNIRRVLVANRGEIAVRIIESCRLVGIESIAVYADSDRQALHVRRADRARSIGGRSASESYLQEGKLIDAAIAMGADAVHPGYGFLSEQPTFAEDCDRAGLIFIGPTATTMRTLGNKVAAKALAVDLGIPVVPGYAGDSQAPDQLAAEADRLGYPLLIKAAAGGGGRGMRLVRSASDLQAGIAAARREAAGAFGDGTVFLERYLAHPRHVEVQLLADLHGAVAILGERDCSVQRRHQKVLEEAPCARLAPATREALFQATKRLAAAAGYHGAGTVEFLVDGSDIFFLEVNTRLQVEHPVTEMVTGVDIVAAQLRIAAGEPLSVLLGPTAARGHAVEARLCAEDPRAGYVPSTGTLTACRFPHLPHVRVDAGVEQGDVVTPYFDSLLAKVCAWGQSRAIAIRRLALALSQVEIEGVATNRTFLLAILGHEAFLEDVHTTTFVEDHAGDLLPTSARPGDHLWLVAAVALAGSGTGDPWKRTLLAGDDPGAQDAREPRRAEAAATSLATTFGPWRHSASARTMHLRFETEVRSALLVPLPGGGWRGAGAAQEVWPATESPGSFKVMSSGATRLARVRRNELGVQVVAEGTTFQFTLSEPPPSAKPPALEAATPAEVRSPMPGMVARLFVDEGARVTANQPLLSIEAMKMEHLIVAPGAGLVRSLPRLPGDAIAAGALLATWEPLEHGSEPA